MSSSGPRAADDINLDEFERRLRAAGAQQARAEDPLAELTRLVEFAHLGISNDEEPSGRRAEPAAPPADSATPLEKDGLRPAIEEEVEDLAPGASEAEREARQDYAFDAHPFGGAADPAGRRRPLRWKIAVSALALAGLAMIGAVFVLRSRGPGFSKDPPFIAAAQGPTKVAPPSDQTVAASSDAGASLLNNTVKPGAVKLVNSEEQPVDLSAQASLDNPPPANPPAAAAQATPAPGSASDATSLAAPVNTPLVAPLAPQPPAMTPEFPKPTPVRTVSLRPDGTPIAGTANPPDQPSAAPEAPASLAPKTASDAAGVPQPSTPRLDLPKPSAKSAARVVVGKTDTTAPEPNAETPRESGPNGASAKPERAAKKPKAEKVADTTGAIAEPPVDATPATASGGWAVQLGAPRSEAEANRDLARLTAKYAAELNGSPIGVHKATVKGATIYRLRVVGLTKADAAKLCARLKGEGGDCFIAK